MKRVELIEEIKLLPFVAPDEILPMFPEKPECSISVVRGRNIVLCNIPMEMSDDELDLFAACLKSAFTIVGVEL